MATTWVINSSELRAPIVRREAVSEAPAEPVAAPEPGELHLFFSQLAVMTSTGVRLDRALALVHLGALGAELASRIRRGGRLSTAMAARPEIFSPVHWHLVRVGEETGGLPAVLHRLADYEARRRHLTARLRSVMFYPLLVAAVCLAMLALAPRFVLPPFLAAMESLGAPVPAVASGAHAVATALTSPLGIFVMALLVVGARRGLAELWREPENRVRARRFLLEVPGIGRALERAAQARAALALASALRAGLSLLKAIPLAAAASGCPVKEEQANVAVDRLCQGHRVAVALGPMFSSSPALLSLVSVGEESGRLPRMLERGGELLEGELERDLETAFCLIEPLALAAGGFLVGSLVLSMVVPMARVIGQL